MFEYQRTTRTIYHDPARLIPGAMPRATVEWAGHSYEIEVRSMQEWNGHGQPVRIMGVVLAEGRSPTTRQEGQVTIEHRDHTDTLAIRNISINRNQGHTMVEVEATPLNRVSNNQSVQTTNSVSSMELVHVDLASDVDETGYVQISKAKRGPQAPRPKIKSLWRD